MSNFQRAGERPAAPCAIGKRPAVEGRRRVASRKRQPNHQAIRACPVLLLPACPMKGLRFLIGRCLKQLEPLNLRRRAPVRRTLAAVPISDGDAGTGGGAGLLGGQGTRHHIPTTPLPETRRPCPLHTCYSGQPTLESP
jgi:hypothetical protein